MVSLTESFQSVTYDPGSPLSINLTIPGLNDDRPDPTWTSSLRVALQRFAVLIMRESSG